MHEQFHTTIDYKKLIEMQANGETLKVNRKSKPRNAKANTKSKGKVKSLGIRRNS